MQYKKYKNVKKINLALFKIIFDRFLSEAYSYNHKIQSYTTLKIKYQTRLYL